MIARKFAAALLLTALTSASVRAGDPDVDRWSKATHRQASPITDRHVIHSYFNTSPESADGKYVLYYTSASPTGEKDGDLRILERATGKETIIATGLTTEDAHRVACQQWSGGGKYVLWHNLADGHWRVMAYEVATGKTKVLAEDRQLGYGSETGHFAPMYGMHWNPGPHRDLELCDVETGKITVPFTAEAAVKAYPDFMIKQFGSGDVTVFFPIMSPDESKVFFKPNQPTYTNDYHGMSSSAREGKVVYDLKAGQFIQLIEKWGHPSWMPDSKGIFEIGNYVFDLTAHKALPRPAPSCISDHPSVSPDAKLFVTDGETTKREWGVPGHWAVAVGSMKSDDWVVIDMFDNTKGATTWRHNHPHPHFSPDGKRIYYNVNDAQWTKLMVAEVQ